MNTQDILTIAFEAIAVVGFTSIFLSYLSDIMPNKKPILVIPEKPSLELLCIDASSLQQPAPAPTPDAVVEPELVASLSATSQKCSELQPDAAPTIKDTPQAPDLYAQATTVIDQLGKREARRLCAPLGIQQKRNGVELSTEFMVAEIRSKFKAEPERVINVIHERLPKLSKLLTVTTKDLEQQQAS